MAVDEHPREDGPVGSRAAARRLLLSRFDAWKVQRDAVYDKENAGLLGEDDWGDSDEAGIELLHDMAGYLRAQQLSAKRLT